MTNKEGLTEKVELYEKALNEIAKLEDDMGNDLRAKTVLEEAKLVDNACEDVFELARKIRSEGNLYTWETALKEAERFLDTRKKMKEVNSYYSKHY